MQSFESRAKRTGDSQPCRTHPTNQPPALLQPSPVSASSPMLSSPQPSAPSSPPPIAHKARRILSRMLLQLPQSPPAGGNGSAVTSPPPPGAAGGEGSSTPLSPTLASDSTVLTLGLVASNQVSEYWLASMTPGMHRVSLPIILPWTLCPYLESCVHTLNPVSIP